MRTHLCQIFIYSFTQQERCDTRAFLLPGVVRFPKTVMPHYFNAPNRNPWLSLEHKSERDDGDSGDLFSF